ncbi:TP53-binding protein 1 isoform X1 [Sergentomyia squamirostris]
MNISEPIEKAASAALHVDDGAETAKIAADGDVRTNSTDLLKRRHSDEVETQIGSEPKKLKTTNNGEGVEEDDDDDLIAKLEAIDAPVVNKDMTKPADVLKKLEEDGKSDDLLERMECIVEGKTPPSNNRPATDTTDDSLLADLEEATKEDPKPSDTPEKPKIAEEKESPISDKKEQPVTPKKDEVKEIPKEVKKPDELKKEEIKKAEELPKKVDRLNHVVAPKSNDENVISSTTDTSAKSQANLPQQSNIPTLKTPEKTPVVPAVADSPKLNEVKAKEATKVEEKVKTPEKSVPAKEKEGEKNVVRGEAPTTASSSDEKSPNQDSSISDSAKHNGIIESANPTSSTLDEIKQMEVDSAEVSSAEGKDVLANGKRPEETSVAVQENEYEVKFCFEQNDIKYLHINKKDTKISALPESSEGKKLDDAIPPENQQVTTIKGMSSLYSFIMDNMKKLNPEEDDDEVKSKKGRPSSSKSQQKASPVVKAPVTTSSGRKSIPKAAATMAPVTSTSKDSKVGFCVMARWVDKMYYAGRVVEEKSGGKYIIHFEDGANKTLNSDVIVFGRGNLMPFFNQSVHALVEEDTYEPGIVTEVTIDQHDKYWYTVVAESKTVVRTTSGIYLEDDQAKTIQAAIKKNPDAGLIDVDAVKRVNRATPTPSESSDTSSTGRKRGRKSDSKGGQQADAEPGFSGAGDAKKSRRGKRLEIPPPSINLNESQSSDISDIPDVETSPSSPDSSALEAIDGVQPELQKTTKEIDRMRRWYFDECLKNGRSLDDLLGPIPTVKNLFKNKSFILTITFESKLNHHSADFNDERHQLISDVPFFKDHLQRQIEAGGGKVYKHWEDVPKSKYANCKLITPFPCITAKYVQCLATGINAVSHLWIIESCRNGQVLDVQEYILPSGWSVIEKRYVQPTVKRVSTSSKAFADLNIMLTSGSKDFTEFWSRVCKLAGAASVSTVKSLKDISTTEKGFLLVGGDVSPVMIEKAKDFNISVVSTVWVVQSLISGKCCSADAHESLSTLFTDDC